MKRFGFSSGEKEREKNIDRFVLTKVKADCIRMKKERVKYGSKSNGRMSLLHPGIRYKGKNDCNE